MEGGPAIFAEPNEIADRYKKAMTGYLDDVRKAWSTSRPSTTAGSADRRGLREGADERFLGGPRPIEGGEVTR